ncbi:MAG: hypothetical protein U1D30_09775 [Planctomycetota bacterium]
MAARRLRFRGGVMAGNESRREFLGRLHMSDGKVLDPLNTVKNGSAAIKVFQAF